MISIDSAALSSMSTACTYMSRIPHSNVLMRCRLQGAFHSHIPILWRLDFAGLLSVALGFANKSSMTTGGKLAVICHPKKCQSGIVADRFTI